ncbi:hypothetical protein OG216_25860 [Streptomycetaceae bacterium NBC_01309]
MTHTDPAPVPVLDPVQAADDIDWLLRDLAGSLRTTRDVINADAARDRIVGEHLPALRADRQDRAALNAARTQLAHDAAGVRAATTEAIAVMLERAGLAAAAALVRTEPARSADPDHVDVGPLL